MRGGGAGDSRFAWWLTLQGEKKPASRVKLWDQATPIRRKRRGRVWIEERRASGSRASGQVSPALRFQRFMPPAGASSRLR
jgi:hypothetical protein